MYLVSVPPDQVDQHGDGVVLVPRPPQPRRHHHPPPLPEAHPRQGSVKGRDEAARGAEHERAVRRLAVKHRAERARVRPAGRNRRFTVAVKY